MKLMFVYYAFENQGSGLVIQGYTEAARALGHEVAVYGPSNPNIPLHYSLDVASNDAVIFIFEWTTASSTRQLSFEDHLDLLRLVAKVPRERRVILDGDGNYNDVIRIAADYNHRDAAASQRWIEICDSLADKICQPTLHPLRRNVRPFLFYAYNPAWALPLDFRVKEFGMIYVGHCKFRWGRMHQVLQAIEPVRGQVGRIALVGVGWDALPPWATLMKVEDNYFSNAAYLRKLGVEVLPPVPFEHVISWMSKGFFNPVISRPTFDHLRLVTPRLFETLAASTIPLFGLDKALVQEIYGEQGLELLLPDTNPHEKILDIVGRPEHYQHVIMGIRQHLTEKHSHAVRLQELIEIVES
jgi:hypothetical protein